MPADSWKLSPGLQNVGSYQVSGRPFATGSCLAPVSGSTVLTIYFPFVTKWVAIEPRALTEDVGGANRYLRVGSSENGLHGKQGANFVIHPSSSLRGPLDLKITELHFMSEGNKVYEFDILAGLTNISVGRAATDNQSVHGSTVGGGPSWSGSYGVG